MTFSSDNIVRHCIDKGKGNFDITDGQMILSLNIC